MVSAERSYLQPERRVRQRSGRCILTYRPLESLADVSLAGRPTLVHSFRASQRRSGGGGLLLCAPELSSELQPRFQPQARHIRKAPVDGGSDCGEIPRLPPVAAFHFHGETLAILRAVSADRQ